MTLGDRHRFLFYTVPVPTARNACPQSINSQEGGYKMKCKYEKLQSLGLLWLRVLMGTGIAYHGYGKIFGGGMEQFAGFVSSLGIPMPEVAAWAAALTEFGGGILVVLGLLTRVAALFLFLSMSVAVFIAHGADPFMKKELALAYWTIAGALILTGSGCLGLDAKFCPWEKALKKNE